VGDTKKENSPSMMEEMMKMMMSQKEGGGMSMMEMMNMMGGGEGKNPMDMCRRMMGSMRRENTELGLITPELQRLFEEWVAHLENEILEKNTDQEGVEIETLMEQLQLSKESVVYLVARLASSGKLKLTINT